MITEPSPGHSLAFYLDFATKQEGLRRFIDSKGL